MKALANHLLLEYGHAGRRDFYAQIAARDHDSVCGLNDGVDVVHALLILDFGDNLHPFAAVLAENFPDSLHVRRLTHERRRDKVEVVLNAEDDVRYVLFCQRGETDMHARDVDGLIRGECPGVGGLANNLRVADFLHVQFDKPVVDENPLSALYLLREIRVRHGDHALVAHDVAGSEGKDVAGLEFDAFRLEGADTDFGAFGVQHGGDGETQTVTDSGEGL